MADNPWDEKKDEKLSATLDRAQEGGTREWRLIEKLLMGLHAEQRRSRRWGIFFKLLTFAYITWIILLVTGWQATEAPKAEKHTALVEIDGLIAPEPLPTTQTSCPDVTSRL